MTETYFDHNDLIFNDNKIGGFSVQNIMEKLGMSPIMILNTDLKIGGGNDGKNEEKVSDLFTKLAVPSWATMHYMQKGGYDDKIEEHNRKKKGHSESDSDSDIDEDLHDKLLALVKDTPKNEDKKDKKDKNKIKLKKTKNNNKKDKNKNITKKIKIHK
jgi:hypothetical protein